MRIRRSRLTAEFVQLPNATVRDDRLSYVARGILAELLSRPDGWEVNADELARLARLARGSQGEGRRTVRAAFAELKSTGYLVSTREKLDGGRFGTVLTLYDVPGGTGVPPAGTPVRQGKTGMPAGGSDVPPAGTPEDGTGVPPAGTSAPSALTDVPAGGSDVPPAGVPVGGTSYRTREKKTGEKTGSGDGRRPPTGSRAASGGGFAAPQGEPSEKVSAADVARVVAGLPAPVRSGLDRTARFTPPRIIATIRGELRRGITADRLIERATDRWHQRGHNDDPAGIRRPIGIACALVRNDCTSAVCDDGNDMWTGQPCRTCEREREDRRAAAPGPIPQEG